MRRGVVSLLLSIGVLGLGACAPGATRVAASPADNGSAAAPADTMAAADQPCASPDTPVVAVIQFDNTTAQYGTTVTGVEDAATARLITLMKESGCYTVVERSVLQDLIAQQGLESTDPVELAKAAGAGYVVTGVVTRATIAKPQVGLFGVSVGAATARVEVDVRATDIITGEVVVSMTGGGDASNPKLALNRTPVGRISYDDPTLGPLLAEASTQAVDQVVAAIRAEF